MPCISVRFIRHILLITLMACASTAAAQPMQNIPDPELKALLLKAAQESDSFVDRFDAEVWLTDMSSRLKKFVPDAQRRIRLLKQIHYEATRAELPPELVLAVIEVESLFDPYAISNAGALGLMQVMPFWLKEIGRPNDNLFDVRTNLRFGCTILRHYLDKEQGDLTDALHRYNGSFIGRKYSRKVYRALDKRWRYY